MVLRSIAFHLLVFASTALVWAQPDKGMVRIEGGAYLPLYGSDSITVVVDDFLIDKVPVTNSEFLDFVQSSERWQKSKATRLFADGNYLAHWSSDTAPGPKAPDGAPVTYVSWFAAKQFCQSHDKRLPTMDEWEYVAMADESVPDARRDTAFKRQILEWYERPTAAILPEVGGAVPNYWGVYDLHGLVWEWVLDFNSVLTTGESRKDAGLDRNLFCAGSAVGSTDLMDYAAFMRYAFRSSLEANYTVKHLGFRCAKSIAEP